jgi:transposase-like protein
MAVMSVTIKVVVVAHRRMISQSITIMITIKLQCRHCRSENIVRNGFSPNGKQKFLCRDCDRQNRLNPSSNAYTDEQREQILRVYQERNSLRGLTRNFGVSRNTVSSWIKKN